MSQYLLLKKLRVQNANALSSPFTFGFPAVTAFMGFAHRIQREFNPTNDPDSFLCTGIGIVSHHFTMQDYQEGYNRCLKITANPLDKEGDRPSFIEEGRCHLTVSLLLEIENLPSFNDKFLQKIRNLLAGRLKLAGGDLLYRPDLEKENIRLIDDKPANFRQLIPGYALIERKDLMLNTMQTGQDSLSALYDALVVKHRCSQDEQGKVIWQSQRKYEGWLVPIATGFHALTSPALAEQQRDAETPHRFAESVVTLGEFKMPLPARFPNGFKDLMWRYQVRGDLYLCTQDAYQN
ncbi:type I-F CRISPR-associated protein Csy2 [uncultured Thiothrix sp.]|uniref:type I-F CRISPR-associated protein Csy2 n=1 Tax=uncultured Thiothrix sp. TaxID=223185 RepID=UPI0026369BDD|nr:type I-F CRISPR-associated protein Csy2 [uncultured Thiothrix sp.]